MIRSTGRCDSCDGIVANIGGDADRGVTAKRHGPDRLTAIHNQSCPGRGRLAPTNREDPS